VCVGDDGVVETRAPAAVAGVDAGRACNVELGGGGLDFLDGCDGVNTFGPCMNILVRMNTRCMVA
jgi:hypothetical protein